VAAQLRAAAEEVGLPEGTISLVHGASSHVGEHLVRAPQIEAVGFTGSIAGGRALCDVAATRERPIPVYAEMGSVNPLLVTTAALEARGSAIAEGLSASIAGGTGQFCTKPGVVLVPDDAAGRSFVEDVVSRLAAVGPAPLLNQRIHGALREALARFDHDPDVERLSDVVETEGGGYLQAPMAFAVRGETMVHRPDLLQERFGPVVVFVRYGGPVGAAAVLDGLEGQLTATVHAEAHEVEDLREVVARMEARAGRLIWDGFPTGVAVTHAMQHGGPYPSSSSPLHTSVGSTAIRRFLRPVVWQNAPAALLPAALRDENPRGIWRLVNGQLTRDAL
jgi:NADP-dependent aldehyde dehydrogenase